MTGETVLRAVAATKPPPAMQELLEMGGINLLCKYLNLPGQVRQELQGTDHAHSSPVTSPGCSSRHSQDVRHEASKTPSLSPAFKGGAPKLFKTSNI